MGNIHAPLVVRMLFSQAETGDECSVSLKILVLEISKKVSSLTYHLEQASSGVMVLLVDSEMFIELIYPVCKNGYLYLR